MPRGRRAPTGSFNADDQWVDAKDQRRVDDFIVYGLAAAEQAVEDSGWKPQDEEERSRTGVMIGSGIGGLPTHRRSLAGAAGEGPAPRRPFFIPRPLINLVSGQVSIRTASRAPTMRW